MKDLFTVGRAIGLLEAGKSISFVSQHLKVARSTVREWMKRWSEQGSFSRRKSSGQPQKTSSRSNRLLVRLVKQHRFANCRILVSLWGEHTSRWTVSRRIKNCGLRQYRCAVKPFLSQYHREVRYKWAQNHVFWSIERFTKIVWSDESRFRLFVNDGRVRVWRERGERFRDDFVRHSCQAGAGSILAWGAIWFDNFSMTTPPPIALKV